MGLIPPYFYWIWKGAVADFCNRFLKILENSRWIIINIIIKLNSLTWEFSIEILSGSPRFFIRFYAIEGAHPFNLVQKCVWKRPVKNQPLYKLNLSFGSSNNPPLTIVWTSLNIRQHRTTNGTFQEKSSFSLWKTGIFFGQRWPINDRQL